MQLAERHEIVAVEVRDRREQELPDAGYLWLVDPETGRELRVDTRDRGVRTRFAQAAAAERDDLRHILASTATDHLVLSTSGDWLRRLASFLAIRTSRR
jgi:hypothetical protein